MEGQNDNVHDITAAGAYSLLKADPRSQLVDVRSKAEWIFVGAPDLSAVGKETLFIEWQAYPPGDVVPDFADALERELGRRRADRADVLAFLCRSGARSMAAARVMALRGWSGCRNVVGGFEGPLDGRGHRGAIDGWKAAGLPWVQS